MPDPLLSRQNEPPVECPNGICDRLQIAEWDVQTLQTTRDEAVASATLTLAQALRLIRDTCPSSAASGIAAGALERAGIEDPEDDCAAF